VDYRDNAGVVIFLFPRNLSAFLQVRVFFFVPIVVLVNVTSFVIVNHYVFVGVANKSVAHIKMVPFEISRHRSDWSGRPALISRCSRRLRTRSAAGVGRRVILSCLVPMPLTRRS
jgi:hypothetical protein